MPRFSGTQPLSHAGSTSGASALERPLSDPEDRRRLGYRVLHGVNEKDRPLLVGREGRPRDVPQLLPVKPSALHVTRIGWLGRRRLPPSPHEVGRRVDNDPVQPGRDLRVSAEPVGVTVGGCHRLLHSVLSLRACDAPGQRVQPLLVPSVQGGERVAIALKVQLQELSVRLVTDLAHALGLTRCAAGRTRRTDSPRPPGT